MASCGWDHNGPYSCHPSTYFSCPPPGYGHGAAAPWQPGHCPCSSCTQSWTTSYTQTAPPPGPAPWFPYHGPFSQFEPPHGVPAPPPFKPTVPEPPPPPSVRITEPPKTEDHTEYLFYKSHVTIKIPLEGKKLWKLGPAEQFTAHRFLVPTNQSVKQLMQLLGHDPEKFSAIECIERNDGSGLWLKGISAKGIEAATLDDLGWGEAREKSSGGVWLCIVKNK